MRSRRNPGRLESWKAIARHLNRSVRTVRRWEKSEQLPVRRHLHERGATVYALVGELDAWLGARGGETTRFEARSWRLPAAAAVLAGGLLLVALTREPDEAPPAVGPWILVTDFQTDAPSSALQDVVEHMVRSTLEDHAGRVVARQRVNDTMRLAGMDRDAPLDRQRGLALAARDGGIGVLVSGRLETRDGDTRIEAVIEDVNGSSSRVVVERVVDGSGEPLPQIGAFAVDLARQAMRLTRTTDPPRSVEHRVSTDSVEAMSLFTKADGLIATGSPGDAAQLLQKAVEIDPGFTSAHLWLYYADPDAQRGRQHLELARTGSATVTERERLFIEATYQDAAGDRSEAITAYRVLLRFHADHHWGNRNLHDLLRVTGWWAEMLPIGVRLAEASPLDLDAQAMALRDLLIVGDHDGAGNYIDRIERLLAQREVIDSRDGLGSSKAWVLATLAPSYVAWASGQPVHALVGIERAVQDAEQQPAEARAMLLDLAASFALGLGEHDLVRKYIDRLEALVPAADESAGPGFAGHENQLGRRPNGHLLRAWLALAEDDAHAFRHHAARVPVVDQLALYFPWAGMDERGEGLVDQIRDTRLTDYEIAFLHDVFAGVRAHRAGDAERAIQHLEAARRNHGPNPTRIIARLVQIEHLARAYLSLGRRADALKELEAIDALRPAMLALQPTSLYPWTRCEGLRDAIARETSLAGR